MIYIASPYSKYPGGIGAAFREVSRICGALVAHDMDVYSPIAHCHPLAVYGKLDPFNVELWKRVDAPFLELCSECLIAKMENWENSVGAALEVDRFRAAGKRVRYLDPDTLEITDEP